DGIRDDLVTGVQTCALPIYARALDAAASVHPARLPDLLPLRYCSLQRILRERPGRLVPARVADQTDQTPDAEPGMLAGAVAHAGQFRSARRCSRSRSSTAFCVATQRGSEFRSTRTRRMVMTHGLWRWSLAFLLVAGVLLALP